MALVMILPWVVGLIAFNLYPIGATLVLSFTEYNALRPPEFVGFENYARALSDDPLFWKSLTNTLTYVALSVPTGIAVALGFALMVGSRARTGGVFRAIFYLPMIVPTIATSTIFLWLFNNRTGVINYLLQGIGVGPIPWLTSETWAIPALVLISLWTIGAKMVIYIAALQSIPRELYEAAIVDGASSLQRARAITLPLMVPAIFFTLILGVIESFQAFTVALVVSGGGPLKATWFYMLHVYDRAFTRFEFGYASALAWILFVLVLALTFVFFRALRGRIYYEGETSAT